MKYKNNWKKILSIGLGLTLTFGQAAYAEIIIPPFSAESGAGGLGNNIAGPVGNTGMGNNITGPAGNGGTGNNITGPAGNGGAGNNITGPAGNGGMGSNITGPAGNNGAGNNITGPAGSGGTGNTQTGNNPAGNTNNGTSGEQNSIKKPTIASEGAVLLDAATGQVLFGKNEHQQFFPASITKIMTALLVLERCNLNDVVTFSSAATTNLESGAVSLNITAGDRLTVEQSLYGLLLKSANEIGNGLAEHVAGSVSAFADLMNARARELGCQNTNFRNPHGLNDAAHKTTPYDMALIMRAALQNETFRRIDSTTSYKFPATKKSAERTITMGHKMLYPSDSRYYAGIIGGKTGYTSKAGNTLVTGVEKNGVRLIAVVMKSKSTHYEDTKAMLDYGFANYAALTGGNSTGGSSTGGSSTGGNAGGTIVQGNGAAQPRPETKRGWAADSAGWRYYKEDGSCAANEWQTVDGLDYWFDANSYMATGWRNFTDGSWYYFKPSIGYMMKDNWINDREKWYYVGADGKLLTNTTTPDGYPVNEYGIWEH